MNHKYERQLKPISPDNIPNVLLVGNGINRCFSDISWDSILLEASNDNSTVSEEQQRLIKEMPYPLQAVVMTHDQVDVASNLISDKLLDLQWDEKQIDLLQKGILDLPIDAILTTNYSYDIERAIDSAFYCKKGCPSKYRVTTRKTGIADDQFNIYKYMNVHADDNDYQIWHIHGEAARPNSIVLGHYFYGKLLSRIQLRSAEVLKSYNISKRKGVLFQPQSWIDYFLLGNIYVIGFGMHLSEMDLWWLVNCKKRNFPDSSIHFWGTNFDEEKNYTTKMLMNAYGINLYSENVGNYYDYYKKVFSKIRAGIVAGIISD